MLEVATCLIRMREVVEATELCTRSRGEVVCV